jgi:hypothetical protein
MKRKYQFKIEDQLSLEEQLDLVHRKDVNISLFENPSEQLQLEATHTHFRAFKYINNPLLSIQLEHVKYDGKQIEDIDNPCEEVQLASINAEDYEYSTSKKGRAIKHIKNPTYKAQQRATELNYKNLNYVESKVQLECINRLNIKSYERTPLSLITNPCIEVQLACVRTENYKIDDFHGWHDESGYHKGIHPRVQLEIVRHKISYFKDIEDPSLETQLFAMQKDGDLLQYVTNPCFEVQLEALRNCFKCMPYITDVEVLCALERERVVDYIQSKLEYGDGSTVLHYVCNEAIIHHLLNWGINPTKHKKKYPTFEISAYCYNHMVCRVVNLRDASEEIGYFLKKCKWYRLDKLVRSKVFCEWYYSPDNTGGIRAKRRIAKTIE